MFSHTYSQSQTFEHVRFPQLATRSHFHPQSHRKTRNISSKISPLITPIYKPSLLIYRYLFHIYINSSRVRKIQHHMPPVRHNVALDVAGGETFDNWNVGRIVRRFIATAFRLGSLRKRSRQYKVCTSINYVFRFNLIFTR